MPDPVKRKRWAPGWSDMEFPDGTTVPYYDPEDAELGGTATAEEVNAFYGAPVAEDYGPPLPPPQEPAGFATALNRLCIAMTHSRRKADSRRARKRILSGSMMLIWLRPLRFFAVRSARRPPGRSRRRRRDP